jgi:hypothetical protein
MAPPDNSRIEQDVSEDLARAQESGALETLDAHALPDGINSSEVWNAVEQVCRSQTMSGCSRLTQLLNFVVKSTLEGEAAYLKETTIGVSVFGREPDYDPKVDTIVRSQAWRLRAKLRKYYASEGANDRIVVDIPIGHYVPVFHIREAIEVAR